MTHRSKALRHPNDFVSPALKAEMQPYTVTAAMVVFEFIGQDGEPQLLTAWDNQSTHWVKQGMVRVLQRGLDEEVTVDTDSDTQDES